MNYPAVQAFFMGERWIINLVRVFEGGWREGEGGGGQEMPPPLFLSQSSSPLGSLLTHSSPLALPRPKWQQRRIIQRSRSKNTPASQANIESTHCLLSISRFFLFTFVNSCFGILFHRLGLERNLCKQILNGIAVNKNVTRIKLIKISD